MAAIVVVALLRYLHVPSIAGFIVAGTIVGPTPWDSCRVGELSFVLLLAAKGTGLLEEPFQSNLTVAIILTMLVTPLGLALGPHLAAGLGKLNPRTRLLHAQKTAETGGNEPLRNHVIIDLNTANVRDAARQGVPIYFGDVTSAEVLEHLGAA